jgi:hypothetical protein
VADEDIIVVSELVGNIEMQEFKAGTVYIFDKEFSLQTTLTPPNSEELNYFGYSLALNEGFIFVGDRQATASGQERAGIIYVYDRLGAFQYTLEADAPSKGAYFGESIAVKKDLLIIGEPYFDHETVDTGKIYIYKESNGNYVLEDEIVPSEPTAKGMFGKTVSVSDEKIIVGQLGMEKVYIYSLLEILPPEFNYANLNVPDEVSKNNAAIITINCTNSGSISGSTTICMSIDGEMVDEKMVSIDAGQTKTVIFTYSTGEVGVHKVEIEGLDTEYEVKKGIPGFPINSITTGLLITIFLINILARKD